MYHIHTYTHISGTQTDYSLLSAPEKDNCLLHEEVWKLRHEARVIKKSRKKIVFKAKNQNLDKARLQGRVHKQRGEMQVLKNETSALKKNIKTLMEEKAELENMIHRVEEEQAKRNGNMKRTIRKRVKMDLRRALRRYVDMCSRYSLLILNLKQHFFCFFFVQVHSHIESKLNRKQRKAKTKHGWPIRRRKVGVEW